MKSSQLKVLFLMLLFAAAVPLFAQVEGLETVADKILTIITGKIVQVVLVCCLCGCAIAYAFNKDNEKMKRNIIAIAIGIGILVAAQGIVKLVWEESGGKSWSL